MDTDSLPSEHKDLNAPRSISELSGGTTLKRTAVKGKKKAKILTKRMDAPLSEDEPKWLSPSYKGLSPRSEYIVMSALMAGLAFVPYVGGIVGIVFWFPLLFRRCRQMGFTLFGLLVIIICVSGRAMALVAMINSETIGILFGMIISIIPGLIVMFYGGTYAGAKTPLMKAAIIGDFEAVRRLCVAVNILQKNARGFTAFDYAKKAGHFYIAKYLEEQEQIQLAEENAKAENNG